MRTFLLVALVMMVPVSRTAMAEVSVPRIAWGACPSGAEAFDCATVAVPMDYARPENGKFDLALIRQRASGPGSRIGTLFWNPGGPGDAGTQYLPAAINGFPTEVRARFDIVSWDPRGMGGRTRPVIRCFGSASEEEAFLHASALDELPVTSEELAANASGRAAFNASCVAKNGDLLAHVSTADNARDLDLLRRAVGDERLSYYGTSYGTFLGATYANMFPERLRAAVLDGAVAPSAWAGNAGEDMSLGTFLRIGSDFGAMETTRAFMDQCGAVAASACAFSAGSPDATRRKWAELLKRGKEGIPFEGRTIDDRTIIDYLTGSIYLVDPLPGFGRFPGWVAVAEFLQTVWEASEGKVQTEEDDASAQSDPKGDFVTSAGRQLAVVCGESPNPGTGEAVSAQALASYARAGLSPWPFVAACLGWTARAADPWLGPWNNRTAAPILVIGNTFDPATPLPSSQRMAQELADARLLVVNGFGHTVLLNPSHCAQDYIQAYLIAGTLPPAGAECDQEELPFAGD